MSEESEKCGSPYCVLKMGHSGNCSAGFRDWPNSHEQAQTQIGIGAVEALQRERDALAEENKQLRKDRDALAEAGKQLGFALERRREERDALKEQQANVEEELQEYRIANGLLAKRAESAEEQLEALAGRVRELEALVDELQDIHKGTERVGEQIRRNHLEDARRDAWTRFAAVALKVFGAEESPWQTAEWAGDYADAMLEEWGKRFGREVGGDV